MLWVIILICSHGYAVYGKQRRADNDGIDIAYAKEFCRSHSDQINLTGVTRVTTGVIFRPDYESESYKKLRDRAVCIINFSAANMSGQQGSLIVFRMLRGGSTGPCLENTVIKTRVVKGECPEEKVIMGPDGINLTLELGKHTQPSFHIKFTDPHVGPQATAGDDNFPLYGVMEKVELLTNLDTT